MTFVLRLATADDKQGIKNLLYPNYLIESGYSHLDYDEESSMLMVDNWLNNGASIVAIQDNKIVAFVAFQFMRTFYKQAECDVDMFFVDPAYRGAKISRALVESVVNLAELNNAKIIYSSCLSGISDRNNKLYVNLWKKFGFVELGTCLIRK